MDNMTEAILGIKEAISGGDSVFAFDGTKKTYDKIMRKWFHAHGMSALTPAGITELCNKWYEASKDGWDGTVTFAEPSAPNASQVSTGTRGGDNAGLTCTPSTDATEEQDDYAGLPLFAVKNVNYIVDTTTLDIMITAIEGITDNYVQNDPDTYVGCMQMTGWVYERDGEATYTIGYADHQVSGAHCEPLAEAVRVDGTVRPFVVHSKYMSRTVDNKMTSCSGLVPTHNMSHNTLRTLATAPYSGGTTADVTFLKIMMMIKYASLTLDGIVQGCCNYNLQYYAKVAETGVRRILLQENAAIVKGSTVLIGTYAGNADRAQAAVRSISDGAIVTAVENVTISGTTYKAIYVDVAAAFDTAANGDAQTGSTIVSTWHWSSGSCNEVKGNDGSPVSCTSGVYPAKLQGIEYMVGGYEVLADVILNLETIESHSYYVPYIVRRKAKQATSITGDYEKLEALKIACPASAGWQYIIKQKFYKGVLFPSIVGGSSSTFAKDPFYMNADGTTGTREWLSFGPLGTGVARAGVSCLYGGHALTNANWGCLARLSPNGNRGELTA